MKRETRGSASARRVLSGASGARARTPSAICARTPSARTSPRSAGLLSMDTEPQTSGAPCHWRAQVLSPFGVSQSELVPERCSPGLPAPLRAIPDPPSRRRVMAQFRPAAVTVARCPAPPPLHCGPGADPLWLLHRAGPAPAPGRRPSARPGAPSRESNGSGTPAEGRPAECRAMVAHASTRPRPGGEPPARQKCRWRIAGVVEQVVERSREQRLVGEHGQPSSTRASIRRGGSRASTRLPAPSRSGRQFDRTLRSGSAARSRRVAVRTSPTMRSKLVDSSPMLARRRRTPLSGASNQLERHLDAR